MMRLNLLCGVLFTPVFGAGALRLVAGLGQLMSILNGSTDRGVFFEETQEELEAADRYNIGDLDKRQVGVSVS